MELDKSMTTLTKKMQILSIDSTFSWAMELSLS